MPLFKCLGVSSRGSERSSRFGVCCSSDEAVAEGTRLLEDCSHDDFYDSYNNGKHDQDAGVECQAGPEPEEGSVRLVNGQLPNAGQVCVCVCVCVCVSSHGVDIDR